MEKIVSDLPDVDLEEMRESLNDKLMDAGIDEGEVLTTARDDVTKWESYFNENITRGKDDMNFVLRDQWTAVERSEFTRLFKPAMTFNKLYDATKKIAGEQRKNKPDLIVRSLTGKSSQDQINLRADLVRTISYQSENDLVYQTAFKSALMMGFGAFEINLDYKSPKSFERTVRYDIIPDPTRTSFDPTALMPHKGDGNYCARQFVYTKEEFYATFPHVTNPVSYIDPRSLLDFQWETRDTITVCKYSRKEWYPVKLFLLTNGMVVDEQEWEDMQKQNEMVKNLAKDSIVVQDMILDQIPSIKAERKTKDYKIRQYLLTQNQIIDYEEWPSKYLPIVFVDGDSNYIQGMQYTRSFIREARDAQKFINYVGSEVAAEIKNRRREQWLGTPDNILGYEQLWRNPELQNGILVAKPDQKTGQMPQKMPPWELSQSLLMQFQRGNQDIKEILGFSEQEALLGRDVSGKARRERKLEGSMSAYVFFDNLNQAIAQSGRVVMDLLPEIIGDEETSFVVTKPDGKTESVVLNQKVGDKVINRLESGEYDVEIDTGPSFAVQKDIALEFFQQTLQANPQAFSLIADLWAKNLDIQYMPQMVERFKTLVPPAVLAAENGQPIPPQQPDPQTMLQQQQLQLMQAQIQERQADLQLKAQKLQLDQEQNNIDKANLLLKAKELKEKTKLDMFNHAEDIRESRLVHSRESDKIDKDYTVQLAKILADMQKNDKQPFD